MKVTVIFSTYNSPDWMEKVLWGFHYQTYRNFEIVIADDGSKDDTRERIEAFKQKTDIEIKHVWQEDDGFQKTKILNKAIQASDGEYLIFTDGDCIPRKDFIEVHLAYAEPGYFLSGGYFKLPMTISEAITAEDIETGNAFNANWLVTSGLKKSVKLWKLTSTGLWEKILNSLSPAAKTWNGHNASTYKKYIVEANGFDERMQYGGEDCELGDRLNNKGLKAKRIRYSAICLHLDHARGYVTEEMKEKNLQIRLNTQRTKSSFTQFGIKQ